MPKAPAFSVTDEDEKTTIESGWEEEASTTVEQGEVADKIRAIGRGLEQARRSTTNVTSTNGGSMSDEPTVDDQRGAAALAMLPPPVVARLVITAGNDSGQALEVRPGKTYTIGRGIDNDLVLTDIAVSRKHFDIRNEHGSWVLADRGSGNGTLINQRVEDAPFMLASGDMIEIGNTAFRFDSPNGVPRIQSSYDVSVDDDLELSTVSGKPLPEVELATPHQITPPALAPITPPALAPPALAPMALAPVSPPVPPPALAAVEPMNRPKTLPPPAPLPRPRTQSGRPVGYALDRPGVQAQPQPQPLPLPSLAAALAPTMSPMQGMQALPPPLLQPATTLPLPQMANRGPLPPAPLIDSPLGMLPTTLPGQGPPHPARLPFSYPRASDQPPQHAPNGSRGQPMVVASAQQGRDATSTALVQPISYANGQPAMVPQVYSPPPQLSLRVKMVIGGVGLALFAAVATIAIIKGSRSTSDPADKPTAPKVVTPPKPTIESIRDPRTIKSAVPTKADTPAPTTPATAKTDKVATNATTSPTTPNASPTASPTTPNTSPPPVSPTSAPLVATKTDKVATTSTPLAPAPTTPTSPAPTTPTTDKIATTSTSPAPTPLTPTPTSPAPVTAKTDKTDKTDKRPLKHPDKRPDKKPTQPVAHLETDKTNKAETAPATAKTDKKHGGRSTQDVKDEANALYRAKRFADAAALVTASLPSFSGGDSQELKSIAGVYTLLGKAYNVGMAPGTKPTDAYTALRRAHDYDRSVGSAFIPEIDHVLVTAASKAALSYTAAKEYESAFQAVRFAESLGSTSTTNKAVRDKLEEIATELLRSASGELTTNPDDAKKKLHQVQGMVDQKSPLYGKATKQLSDL